MTYRYIFLLLLITEDMFLSRKSRIVGRQSSTEQRRVLAASAGTLLGKSLDLSGEVYLAMQARGYRGQSRTVNAFQMRGVDWVLGGGTIFIAALAIWLGR
jgi:energy-coupling factor transporter transmembrane protein EcfT